MGVFDRSPPGSGLAPPSSMPLSAATTSYAFDVAMRLPLFLSASHILRNAKAGVADFISDLMKTSELFRQWSSDHRLWLEDILVEEVATPQDGCLVSADVISSATNTAALLVERAGTAYFRVEVIVILRFIPGLNPESVMYKILHWSGNVTARVGSYLTYALDQDPELSLGVGPDEVLNPPLVVRYSYGLNARSEERRV